MTVLDELRKTGRHWVREHHPHETGTPVLKVQGVWVKYGEFTALEDVSFDVQAGDRLAVVGPNGAGKSTLLKVIAGVLRPDAGEVHVYGHDPEGHICIAYLPQRTSVDWGFPVTVQDVVMMGRIGKLGLFRNPREEDWRIVRQALEMVDLQDLARRQISQLSGGQQQRMFIARALAQEASLILMDEPLTGLDVHAQEDIFSILEFLKSQEVTVLMAMHDLNLAAEKFDKVILLNHRVYHYGEPKMALKAEHLLAAYGKHLQLVEAESGMIALDDTCCDDGSHI